MRQFTRHFPGYRNYFSQRALARGGCALFEGVLRPCQSLMFSPWSDQHSSDGFLSRGLHVLEERPQEHMGLRTSHRQAELGIIPICTFSTSASRNLGYRKPYLKDKFHVRGRTHDFVVPCRFHRHMELVVGASRPPSKIGFSYQRSSPPAWAINTSSSRGFAGEQALQARPWTGRQRGQRLATRKPRG